MRFELSSFKKLKPEFKLISLILILLPILVIFSLILGLANKEQTIFSKAASKTENNSPPDRISQWVPIDLDWFNQDIDTSIVKLESEKSLLSSQTELSSAERLKRQNVLQRSLSIKKINKDIHNQMDENNDRKISYEEFNKRTVELYEKTYPLKHTKIAGKPNGIYDQQGNLIKTSSKNALSTGGNRFIVMVEAGIFDDILSSLEQYKIDVELTSNYHVEFLYCNSCTKEDIKSVLRTTGIIGTMFVGDLPVAWFQSIFGIEGGVEISNYPDDLYYMDLNGRWGDETNCVPNDIGGSVTCFSSHKGNTDPEIFFGRLTSPSQSDEIALLENYFRKNHLFRLGWIDIPFRALNFFDNVSESYRNDSSNAVRLIYSDTRTIFEPTEMTREKFISTWGEKYDNLWIISHANAYFHRIGSDDVSYLDVASIKPRFNFFTLDGCSIANYTVSNYLGGWYIFQNSNYGLVALGVTKAMASNFKDFYFLLSRGDNYGNTLKYYYQMDTPWGKRSKFRWGDGGLTLLGDPTLKVNMPAYPTLTPTPCPPDVPFQQTDKTQINTYCTATSGQICSSPKVWVSPLTCHAAPGWKPFGTDCHGPYCDGCLCASPTPTPYWKDCSYCDTNNDGKVCRDDIENLASNFGKVNLDQDWNSSCPLCAKSESNSCDDCDFNRDGIINIFDLVRCGGACYNCGM